ncbi:MAG TPA: tetratricopeptide repeat protein [Methanoregula sp.]|nr:tetratricopeptide repeat protein [Methanoregula sp.]
MPDIRILCDRAIELAGQGRFDEAILVMNSVIRTDSNNPSIWYNKGLILHKQEKYTDAVNCFAQAADRDPGFIDALYNKGITPMKLGKYNQAIRVFDAIIKQEPKNRQARTAWKQANEALLTKIAPVSPASDIQTRLVKEK